MVTLKFCKKDGYAYLSHIDLLRHIVRIFRRTDIDVEYSQGFNPHMSLNFSVPLPLGMFSTAEYVTVHTEAKAEDVLTAYNAAAPEGLQATAAWETTLNPNLAGKVCCADYSITANGAMSFKKDIEGIINEQSYVLPYPTRRAPDVMRDVVGDIFGLKVFDNNLNVCVSTGERTLRADILGRSLANRFGFETDGTVWRYGQYVRLNGVICSVDEYLAGLKPTEA